MIGANTISAQPDVRPPTGGACPLLWALLAILAVLPIYAFAEAGPEAGDTRPPSAAPAARDWASIPEPEIQARLAEVRTELLKNNEARHRLEFQLQQADRGKELADEIKRIRREIGQLYEQSEQTPEVADELEAQMQELRRQRDDMEAERLDLLNQSEEYRVLSARAGELREQLKSILQALQKTHPEDNAGKID